MILFLVNKKMCAEIHIDEKIFIWFDQFINKETTLNGNVSF